MSGSGDESNEEENIIIPDFEDCKLELLYEDEDLSQDDDDESQDFYTILQPVESENQELFLEVLENLKNAVCADDTNDEDTTSEHTLCSDETDSNHKRGDEHKTSPIAKQLRYACRHCSEQTETELKIKEHIRNAHPERRKRKVKRFYPHIAVDENGVTTVTVSGKTKANIYKKLITPNIQIKGSKVYIEKLQYCDPCITDMSNISNKLNESNHATQSTNKAGQEVSSESVNVPMVMIGKQLTSDQPDTFTLVSSEKQMSLKPINTSSPGISIFKCNSCDYYSNNKHYLKQHMDIVHNSIRPFKCPFCDYAGKRSQALREHLIVHSNERPYECSFCNATFRKKGHLTNHIKLHNNLKTLVKCPLCKDLVSESKAAVGLTGHLQTVHGTDKLYGCDLCEFIAANEPEIVEHLRDKHLKVNIYKCSRCSFDTMDKNEFENHVKSHNRTLPLSSVCSMDHVGKPSPIKPVWIKCTECGFTGQDSEMIRQHMIEHLNLESNTNSGKSAESLSSPSPGENTNVTNVDLVAQGQNSLPSVKRQRVIESVKTDSKTDNMDATKSMTSEDRAHVINIELVSQTQNIQRIKCIECGSEFTSTAEFQKHAEIHKKLVLEPEFQAERLGKSQLIDFHANTKSPTKQTALPKQVLVPMSELIQSNIVKPIPLSSFHISPSKEPSQFIQVSGKNSKDGIRYLPASPGQASGVVTSTVYEKPLVSKTRFVPSNFMSATPGNIVGGKVMKTIPQMNLNQTNKVMEIGQPRLATVIQQIGQNCKDDSELRIPIRLVPAPNVGSLSPMVENKTTDSSKPITASNSSISQQSCHAPNSESQFVLKEIPIPRQVSLSEIPKLPPQIAQIAESTNEQNSKITMNTETHVEENLDSLRKRLASVQELIQQQEKIQRQTGTKQAQILDTRGIPQATDKKNIIYYITPVSKQNTTPSQSMGVTHDSNAGRFRCTICGYTCEFQRTIKAHIWKHSGNKNVEYPMFQNGPLSIYEGDQVPKLNPALNAEPVEESPSKYIPKEDVHTKVNESPPLQTVQKIDTTVVDSSDNIKNEMNDGSLSNLPPFIVYEESKISNVAPALAHLIAARTMVGLGERNKNSKTPDSTSQELQKEVSDEKKDSVGVVSGSKRSIKESDDKHTETETVPIKRTKTFIHDDIVSPINVVVENVQSVMEQSEYTGMKSQQGSPRITNPRSPDSGLSDLTACSKVTDDHSVSSGFFSPIPEGRLVIDDTVSESGASVAGNKRQVNPKEADKSTKADYDKDSSQKEESAVTLLSLLKKGPNFNPACPPKSGISYQYPDRTSQTSSPGVDDTNSTGDSEVSSVKPKSGISSSLLAVIEQLRERSKSDIEDDKPTIPLQAKKGNKRRSRRGSVEDNSSAVDIDNVEQFMNEGEVKYRCKLCHYNNESTVLLRQHMRLHKTKQPFECSLCDFIADSSEVLQDHMIQHCKVRLYQCKMCPSTFNYKSQLRAHMRAHSDLDILMCDWCDFETRSGSSLRAHMRTHEKCPRFTCDICSDVFLSSLALKSHKKRCITYGNDNIDADLLRCGQCGFVASGESELHYHLKGHKIVEQTLKKCPYCEHTAVSVEQVKDHIRSVHGESKHMKCELCGFVALSIRSLKSHMKRHVNDQRFVQQPLEQYKCNLCGYVCHHLPSLKSHMWRHAADEHYSYEFTNEIINSAIDFDGHTEAQDTTEGDVGAFRRLIHNKMKARGLPNTKETTEKSAHALCWVTFRCCQCGFETINKAELNVHMKAHSDVIRWTLEVSPEAEEEDTEK